MKMPEEKMIHTIATEAGIADEQMVRQAIVKLSRDWEIPLPLVLEHLSYFLADGQERRFIVVKFRENVTEAQKTLLEEFRIEIQQWR